MPLTLVLGGIRSGKSGYAEQLAAGSGLPVVYVATGLATDPEMEERIERHRRRRPAGWRTVESVDPRGALGAEADGAAVLVDGLTGWVCALMEEAAGVEQAVEAVDAFGRAAAARPWLVIVVGDEAGLGGVPAAAVARRYLDINGEAIQRLAAAASEAWLLVAGRPLALTPGRGVEQELRFHGDREVREPSPRRGESGAEAERIKPDGLLDFAVNVTPGAAPAALRERLAVALEGAGSYPDDRAAVEAVAARHGRPAAEVLPLNGAAEAFWLLAQALRPARAACVHPSFTEPEAALRAAGAAVVRGWLDPECFTLDPADVDPGAEVVVVGNPNNPTGRLEPASSLEALARPGRVLVVDEAFMDLVVCGEVESLAGRRDIPGLVVVRSLTKAWALPGLRAGYLLGPAELVERLRGARQPWSVNGLALAALEAYGAGDLPAGPVAAAVAKAREALAAQLAGVPGVRVWPGAANFLLIRVPDGPAVRAGLRAQGIAVRRGETFPGLTPDHLRVAVRTPADNARLVGALAAVLS